MTDISVLPGCAFVLSHSLALSLSLSAASHPPCGLSCSQHSSLKEVTLLNDAGFQNRRSRNRQSRSPPRTGTVSLVLYSVVKQLNSLPRFRGEGKYTPSLDGGRQGHTAEQQGGSEIFLHLSLENTICYIQVLILAERPSTFYNGPKSFLLPTVGLFP